MNRKNKILTVVLLLGLGFTAVDNVFGANSLVQMDVKKASADTIDFTMYTSSDAGASPIVRKKSDNKYVVLIPGISSSAISTPDFHGVKDVITNIDVKSVADTADGYTKVTVITKKPLNIRTKTVKSAPITPEQREYRSLLAVANTPKANSINPIKAEQPAVKQPSTVKVSNTVKNQNSQKNTKVQNDTKSKTIQQKKNSVISGAKKIEQISKNETKKVVNKVSTAASANNIEKHAPAVNSPKATAKTVTKTENKPQTFIKELQNDAISQSNGENISVENKPEVLVVTPTSPDKTIKNKFNFDTNSLLNKINAKYPLMLILLPLLALMFMIKFIKNSIEKSRDLRSDFVNKVKNETSITKQYTAITGDENLNWREKYSKYNDAVQDPETYNRQKAEKHKKLFGAITGSSVDEKRKNLEKMISPLENQTKNIVHSEVASINNEMKKTIKLKGFAQKPSLKASDRENLNNMVDINYKIDTSNEIQQNVTMKDSPLTRNIRDFENGSLAVSDVDQSLKAALSAKRQEELRKKDYEMSSLDEYFATIDKETDEKSIKLISTPKEKLTQKEIRQNVENIQKKMHVPLAYKLSGGINLSKAFENPFSNGNIKMISTPKKESAESENLIVNSSYEIDSNNGFMMVTYDSKSALIGKANNEITVLKEFSGIVDKPLQVRKDKDNVYLVKTEGFKSLVEINGNKMGVLIEL